MSARVLLVIGAIGLFAWSSNHFREKSTRAYLASQRFEDIFYAPPPQWLPVLSLGHDEALADLMWIKGLIYFGEALGARTGVDHVFSYVEAILALDKRFSRVYRWASTAGIYKTKVSLSDLRRATDYAERGAAEFPENGELAWEAGATVLYELLPHIKDEREREQLRDRGSAYLERASRQGAGPPWLVLSTLKNLERLGKKERAIAHLQEIYLTTNDAELKNELASRLRKLRGESYAEALRIAIKDRDTRHRQRYPYVEPFLFELIDTSAGR